MFIQEEFLVTLKEIYYRNVTNNIRFHNHFRGVQKQELAEICMLFLQLANQQMAPEATLHLAFTHKSKCQFKLMNLAPPIQAHLK